MSNTKFTKGPWVSGKPSDHAPFCVDAKCNYDNELFEVCSVWGVNDDSSACKQSEANLNLIVMSPELYQQLEESNDCMLALVDTLAKYGHNTHNLLEQVKRNDFVLAKARGG
jgi:hypothetical protein